MLLSAQRAASSSRVSILTVTRKDLPSDTRTLGAAEISLSAAGTYADLKAWLSRVLQEHPNAVLTHLVMARHSGSDAAIRLDLTLALLNKPMQQATAPLAASAEGTERDPGTGQTGRRP